ncbi:hypothetical protein TIFTF001_021562 [Ficus carica]|uniref:Uncharacterized protein n=1 Tax=Ficus carica TaxID=3494 RepID=A0AA88AGY3_FICCA|nr:hypothetical protein TIFTF001_021562 [Ficus carica]
MAKTVGGGSTTAKTRGTQIGDSGGGLDCGEDGGGFAKGRGQEGGRGRERGKRAQGWGALLRHHGGAAVTQPRSGVHAEGVTKGREGDGEREGGGRGRRGLGSTTASARVGGRQWRNPN